jgi:hypothetical protein
VLNEHGLHTAVTAVVGLEVRPDLNYPSCSELGDYITIPEEVGFLNTQHCGKTFV